MSPFNEISRIITRKYQKLKIERKLYEIEFNCILTKFSHSREFQRKSRLAVSKKLLEILGSQLKKRNHENPLGKCGHIKQLFENFFDTRFEFFKYCMIRFPVLHLLIFVFSLYFSGKCRIQNQQNLQSSTANCWAQTTQNRC